MMEMMEIDKTSICEGITSRQLLEYASSVKTLLKLERKETTGKSVAHHEACRILITNSTSGISSNCCGLQNCLRVGNSRLKRKWAHISKTVPNKYLNTPQKLQKLQSSNRNIRTRNVELDRIKERVHKLTDVNGLNVDGQ